MRYATWAVFAAVLGLFGAANTSAYTVTFSPGGTVTATGAAVQFTFNTAGKTINCTTSGFTATFAGGRQSSFPFAAARDVHWLFGPAMSSGSCTVTGGAGVTMGCDPNEFDIAGLTSGGVTAARIGITCYPTVNGSRCRTEILGSVPARFDNSASRLTIDTSGSPGQLLASINSDDGSGSRPPVACRLLPNDSSVSFSDASRTPPVMTVAPTTTLNVV